MEKMKSEGIMPTTHDILDRINIYKTHLDFILTALLDKKCVNRFSNSEYYETYDYEITEEGGAILERYRFRAKTYISKATELYQNNKKDELYAHIAEKRDMLWFSQHERFITLAQLERMAHLIGVSVQKLWYDEGFQGVPTGPAF